MRTWFECKRKKYVQGVKEAPASVYEAFKKRRSQLIRLSLESLLLTLLSLAIVGMKLFYPFHVIVGATVYFFSFLPIGYRIYLSRGTWRQYHAYTLTTGFMRKERWRLFFAVIILLLTAAFLWLRPLDGNPFSNLSDVEVATMVQDDLYKSVTAMDYLETTGNELLLVLEQTGSDTNQTEDIAQSFVSFLQAVTYSESLTDVH
ncbi:hypothetical protein GW937_01530 [Candidatus Kaiserbacteria bacterium]|nr:hypothetical protein [Candidatus Kaiserbacteria bacterium]NCT01697.1 hypothetical protein [Candidatus Parcubacteria bacterium]